MSIQQKSVDFLRIDLNSGKVKKQICICQNDTVMRTLVISLVNQGQVVNLENCVVAEILINKADGFKADNGCVIDGNTVEYTLRSNDIKALGTNEAQIVLTFDDGTVLTSPVFYIEVYSKLFDPKKEQSINEYNSITQQVVIAKAYADAASDSATDAQASAAEASEIAAGIEESVANTLAEFNETKTETETSLNALKTLADESIELVNKYKTEAALSAENASISESNSKATETFVTESVAIAQGYANSSNESATLASNSAVVASESATLSENKANESRTYSETSLEHSVAAETSATNAKTSEDAAKEYARQAQEAAATGGASPATLETLGIVKPDGTTITVDANGVISLALADAESEVY